MKNKAGAPKKDPEIVKSKCGYMLPKWLKDLIREHEMPAGVLIEQVLTKRIKMRCRKCSIYVSISVFKKTNGSSRCRCGERISTFKKVIM